MPYPILLHPYSHLHLFVKLICWYLCIGQVKVLLVSNSMCIQVDRKFNWVCMKLNVLIVAQGCDVKRWFDIIIEDAPISQILPAKLYCSIIRLLIFIKGAIRPLNLVKPTCVSDEATKLFVLYQKIFYSFSSYLQSFVSQSKGGYLELYLPIQEI